MKAAPEELEIRPLGDCAIMVEIGERDVISTVAIDDVLHAQRLLQQAGIRGVTEITTAFASVTLFYDPARVAKSDAPIFTSLETEIRAALASRAVNTNAADAEQQTTEIPVCYDPEFALDLAHVAQHGGLSAEEVINRHVSAEYRVGCVGFTPGFPYLLGLPAELATPRRTTPRTAVPAGSVAIGGTQTGIYPVRSPGGWHVIGRTPLCLFDPGRRMPSVLRAGNRVRFHEISRAEFDAAAVPARPDAVQAPANK